MHNLGPQGLGIDGLSYSQLLIFLFVVRVAHGELLHILAVGGGSLHECVVNLHAHVGTGHFAFSHLGIDESLSIGMLDAHRKHQRTATTILSHLARTVAITLHKRNKAR